MTDFLDHIDASAAGGRARQSKPNGYAPHKLEIVKFKDLNALLNGRPLVKGILEREQLSVIFGETGCGKTFLMLDASLHIAAGREWFGRKVTPGAVVYVAAEAGRSPTSPIRAF